VALGEADKQKIQQAYSDWLSNNSYRPRHGQKVMIALIAKAIASVAVDDEGCRRSDFLDHLCLVEAGTGTGKTVAYAIAGILQAQALNKKLVISTATITLQEQLIFRDLPNLQKTSGIDFSFAIAKGRQRYLCLSKLAQRLQGARDTTEGLFPDETPFLSDSSREKLSALAQDFESDQWCGDRDRLTRSIAAEDWSLIAADRASCSGKKCPQYDRCALFRARDALRSADVVVANHDLVLADMSRGGGNILPSPDETIFVFDEAHHLPGKSQSYLSRHWVMAAEKKRLLQSQKAVARAIAMLPKCDELQQRAKTLAQIDEGISAAISELQPQLESLFIERPEWINSSDELRLPHGVVPDEMRRIFKELGSCYALKQNQLQKLAERVLASFSSAEDKTQLHRESLYAALGDLALRCEMAAAVCGDYARDDGAGAAAQPMVRWLERREQAVDPLAIYAAPLSTANTLEQLLWQRCYAAILTSATLTSLGRFDHFIRQIGSGSVDRSHKILGQLNFSDSIFHVPAMRSEPTQVEAHTDEVIELLPELLADSGSLVLFSSRRQMEAVSEGLEAPLRAEVLVQGDRAKQALVERHKQRIDEGERSVLFGLASFAEGLDLPRDYCQQVVIAKLPFAVPDSPIDQAMGEWVEKNGGSAFWDIAVPAVSTKLLQACGRLLRTESDCGRVSLLDTRILSKRYGRQLLESLPPFQQQLGE